MWRTATAPLAVFVLQAAVLWIWHVPPLYEAALRSDAIHAVQHLCLVVAGGLFWWAMVYGRYGRRGYGLGVLYVFLTAVHSERARSPAHGVVRPLVRRVRASGGARGT